MHVPSAPIRLPRYSVPTACAASSMTDIPCFLASRRMGSMSAGAPAKWTGITSFVRGVMAASMRAASVISVSRSTSTNTGAPASIHKVDRETQVMEGVMTSSPGPIPSALSATCMPPVAEVRATASGART